MIRSSWFSGPLTHPGVATVVPGLRRVVNHISAGKVPLLVCVVNEFSTLTQLNQPGHELSHSSTTADDMASYDHRAPYQRSNVDAVGIQQKTRYGSPARADPKQPETDMDQTTAGTIPRPLKSIQSNPPWFGSPARHPRHCWWSHTRTQVR